MTAPRLPQEAVVGVLSGDHAVDSEAAPSATAGDVEDGYSDSGTSPPTCTENANTHVADLPFDKPTDVPPIALPAHSTLTQLRSPAPSAAGSYGANQPTENETTPSCNPPAVDQGELALAELSIKEQNAPAAAARITLVEQAIRGLYHDPLKQLGAYLGIRDWQALGRLILQPGGWRDAVDPYAWLKDNMPVSAAKALAHTEPSPFEAKLAATFMLYPERASDPTVLQLVEVAREILRGNPEPGRKVVSECSLAYHRGPRASASDYESVIFQILLEPQLWVPVDKPISYLRKAAIMALAREGGNGDQVSSVFRKAGRGRVKGVKSDLSFNPEMDEPRAGAFMGPEYSVLEKKYTDVIPADLIDDSPDPEMPFFAQRIRWDQIAERGLSEGWLNADQAMVLPLLGLNTREVPEEFAAEHFKWPPLKFRRIRKQLGGKKIHDRIRLVLDPRGEFRQ